MKPHTTHPNGQQGVSLLIVLVIMLLSSLLVLGGGRVSNMNEILAGSNTDELQTFEAAQMMIRDAEQDIQGNVLKTCPFRNQTER